MSEPKYETDRKIPTGIKAAGLALLIPMTVVPMGVGVTVLGFLWFGGDQFGGPPVFFKVFGSFIALGFLGFGAIPLIGAIYGGTVASGLRDKLSDQGASDPPNSARNFICPHCSAPVADLADVSSAGDVQCGFCHSWFNTNAS